MNPRTLLVVGLALTALAIGCGDPDVQFSRGLQAYDLGRYDEAIEYWEPLAESGHGRAQYSMGVIYFKGEGVEQDYDEAFGRFQDATDRGTFGAALSLAVMYANGYGTEVDHVAAYKWTRVADSQGDPGAPHWRATLQRQMTAEQIKDAEEQAAAFTPSD